MTFSGASTPNQDYLDVASITVNQPITIVAVWRANGNANYMFDAVSGDRVIIGLGLTTGASGRAEVSAGGATVVADSVSSTGFGNITSALINTTASELWRNGVSRASGTVGSNNIGSIRLGERISNLSGTQLNGYLGSFTALSTSSSSIRKRIEHSFGFVWKLACS